MKRSIHNIPALKNAPVISASLLALLVLSGCAVNPSGPHVTVMPAPGKPFEQFAAEDQQCRQYAQQSIGGPDAAAQGNERAVGSAALGTVIGAAAGSALGSRRNGTNEGAGMGLIVGTAVGAGAGATASQDLQRRYDIAYQQCMYAKGNQLPSAAGYQTAPRARRVYPAAPSYAPPAYTPPPAGYPPPPPAGYAPPPPPN